MLNGVSGLIWISAIELTLIDNEVTGVGYDKLQSAGQLIPLLIGALGLAKVILSFLESRPEIYFVPQPDNCKRCLHKDSASDRDTSSRLEESVSRPQRIICALLPWLLLYFHDPSDLTFDHANENTGPPNGNNAFQLQAMAAQTRNVVPYAPQGLLRRLNRQHQFQPLLVTAMGQNTSIMGRWDETTITMKKHIGHSWDMANNETGTFFIRLLIQSITKQLRPTRLFITY